MITEDYCSPEVFQLLREKGFPVGVGSWSKGFVWDGEGYLPGLVKHENSITHQMAMKWLRKKDVIIVIQPEYFNAESKCSAWGCDIWVNDNYERVQGDFSSYEEAVNAALKYSLENLI